MLIIAIWYTVVVLVLESKGIGCDERIRNKRTRTLSAMLSDIMEEFGPVKWSLSPSVRKLTSCKSLNISISNVVEHPQQRNHLSEAERCLLAELWRMVTEWYMIVKTDSSQFHICCQCCHIFQYNKKWRTCNLLTWKTNVLLCISINLMHLWL